MANDRNDIVVVLGDFNAAVGKDTDYDCTGLQQPASDPSDPSPNDMRLLTAATLANTFFKHKLQHLYTHTSARATAVSRRRRSQVSRLQGLLRHQVELRPHPHRPIPAALPTGSQTPATSPMVFKTADAARDRGSLLPAAGEQVLLAAATGRCS
jgi:hypothetical protein